MSFSRIAALAVLLAPCAAPAVTPEQVKCPTALHGHKLADIGLFDVSEIGMTAAAPVEEMPDKSGWDVDVRGERFTSPVFALKCLYGGTKAFVAVPVPLGAVRCEFRGKGVQIYCR